ncbi:DNA recombination protein RmuC [Paradevosia shaoguanensis]|uniref:DNA recombination protein RmuC homolog n=1 Tax=Paradevosia shaoguanensis TaxID=1335043 RepID=A0AA41QIV0_9HYPH|nr:DNA recombination protein RmuC [Paradevosia shaoguanensis]MCF1740774.1 DNA recombination protein RmuC [Paradevosia shaoguanensis]MCI0125258.1 DNA recombination protein RmuC [Paradevosia shaoguanensis]QMV03782.1 DNA recombination protein RmuC [Devosia sp. D6-9]CDP53341.1 DNA recombination protein RmuC [Devosia sp. DBB001]
MDMVLFTLGDVPVTLSYAIAAAVALTALLLVILLVNSIRSGRQRAEEATLAINRSQEMEKHLADMMRIQNEMTGRMQTMSEIFGSRTSDLARLVNERLDSTSQRMGQAMAETRTKTEESLSKLHERLAVIDRAQSTITELSGEIVSLQSILSNKQQRGAFGQGRMEAIIADGLASNGYAFQTTLSNGSRPDCVIYMPNDAPRLVIDAKFPLESWQRLKAAANDDEAKLAKAQFKTDITTHVRAISDKYLIAGETQDTAFMFVPSESIFADLHEQFEDLVQRAIRHRVVIVSPSLLMLSIQVIQALLRDVRMREQAHLIQKEVRDLLTDVGRLDERVRKLQTHFQQANNDIGDILVSTGKVTRRGEKIDALELDEATPRLAGE